MADWLKVYARADPEMGDLVQREHGEEFLTSSGKTWGQCVRLKSGGHGPLILAPLSLHSATHLIAQQK